MTHFTRVIFALLLLAAGYLIATQTHTLTTSQQAETTFDRVVRTGTLRCAYAVWEPGLTIDPATGAKKGLAVEVAQALAQRLNLKIEWAEEAGWGTAEQGFTTNRYDAMCAHVCSDSIRGRATYFARPFLTEPVFAMVRADDTRFDADPTRLNAPDITLGIMRGSLLDYTARDYMPQAKKIDLAELGTQMDMFLSLTGRKIDASFNTGISIDRYSQKNPGQIKAIGQPLRYCNAGYLLPLGDDRLKNFIDNGFDELLANGTIRRIMTRYYGTSQTNGVPNWQEPPGRFPADQPVAE
jgi:polar amino acid transport system substrate-binding protein